MALGYTPPSSTTTASVKSFGATGDGLTDATTAFAAASAAAGVGGTVVVPKGTYLTTGMTLAVADQSWELAPGAVIQLKANTVATAIIAITANGVTFRGGNVGGIFGDPAASSENAFLIVGVDGVTVEDVTVFFTRGDHVHMDTVTNCRIRNNTFVIYGQAGTTSPVSLGYTGSSSNVWITGNRSEGYQGTGIEITAGGPVALSGIHIESNSITLGDGGAYYATIGIKLTCSAGGTITGATIADNIITGPGATGVLVTGISISGTAAGFTSIKVSGNSIRDCALAPITVTGGVTDIAVSGDTAVNVQSYGITGDGTTNVLAAIQALVTAYGGVRPIRFPKGRYRLGTTGQAVATANRITLPSGTHITCDPGAVFEVNAMDGDPVVTGIGAIFYAAGTDGTKANLTTNIVSGKQTIALPTGVGATYAVGDLIGFESLAEVTPNLPGGLVTGVGLAREIRMVEYITGDSLTLDAPLEFAYNTSDTAKYWKITPARDIVLSGLRFEPGPGVTPGVDAAYAIKLKKVLNTRLENIELHNMLGGVDLDDAYDTLVEGLNVNRLERQDSSLYNAGGGYGLIARACTTKLIVNGLQARECRHVFTTLSDLRGAVCWGGPEFVQINGAIAFGGSNGGTGMFDTHEQGRHITFNDCMAVGGDPIRNPSGTGGFQNGFQIRSSYTTLNNCRAIRCGRQGVGLYHASSNCIVNGGEFSYNALNGIVNYGENNRIVGARVHHNVSSGIVVLDVYAIGTSIQGCEMIENAYGITEASGSTNTVITGCSIPKGTTQTISIIGLTASAVLKDCTLLGYTTGTSKSGMSAPSALARIINVLTDDGVYGNVPQITTFSDYDLRRSSQVATIGRLDAITILAPATGTMTSCLAFARTAGTFTKIRFITGTTVTAVTDLRLGVHDAAGTLLASTANYSATATAASTLYDNIALDTPVVLTAGQQVWLSFAYVGTAGNVRGAIVSTALSGLAPILAKTNTYAGGALPVVGATANSNIPWIELVP